MPIILGGGISGLSAAYYLLKKTTLNQRPKLFEASKRFGGWIKTDQSPTEKQVRFECGPRTLRPGGIRGLNTLELCAEIGLSDDLLPITSKHPAARNRLLAVNNELHLLPSNLTKIFKTSTPFTKPLIYALYHDYTNRYEGKPLKDDSIYSFTERRFGTEIAKYLVSSMICGICAGDAKEISVKFLMKELFEFEQKHSSVTSGIYHKTLCRLMSSDKNNSNNEINCDIAKRSVAERWSIYSMKNGMETLPKALSNHLSSNNVELNLNSKCENIEFHQNGVKITIDGKMYETNCLISSLPAFELGKLVQRQHPILAKDLLDIPYVDVAVINLQFDCDDLLKTPGFGFLVPPSENLSILGVIYDSCCFDMGKNTVLTVMMGGRFFQDRLGTSNEKDLYDKAIREINSILKIDQKPKTVKINILNKCIPQYVVGHHERIDRIMNYIHENKMPLKVCGTAYDGVGVNDAIYSAKVAVDSL